MVRRLKDDSTVQKELNPIKDAITESHAYFVDNYKMWHGFRKFLYITSLTDADKAVLNELNKPQLEFNILESYVSRQKGEFSKQEPSIKVRKGETGKADPMLIDVVEGHMRYMENKMRKDLVAYKLYDDALSGGFGVAKIRTAYANELSFEQNIIVERHFEPTLCGFDPVASLSHKGDGSYAFELTPYSEEQFKIEFGRDVNESDFKCATDLQEFHWSYKNQANQKFILVATFYKKREEKAEIVKLADGQVMREQDYNKFLIDWEEQSRPEQAPQIIKSRSTVLTTIDRYRVVENEIIQYKKTDFRHLPLVFFDGNSVTYRETLQSPIKQCTRPYCYQARGIQQLKNYAGQTLANEIESMVQHKFMVPIEGIPVEYKEAYIDPQVASVLVYNSFKDNNPEIRLDKPQVIPRVPLPQEVIAAFDGADKTTQAILGTYDAALGIQKNQLSGVALIEGATQSNATAMPSLVGFMNGMARIAEVYLDLMPKYLIDHDAIPVLNKKSGSSEYADVNSTGNPSMKFAPNTLKIDVSAGVNFEIQKNRALTQLIELMKVSPILQEFISTTPAGIKTLLDNIEMRGIDQLKEEAEKYAIQWQQKQAQQAQQKPDPQMMKIQLDNKKLALEEQQNEKENQLEMARVSISDKDADTKRLKVMTDAGQAETAQELKKDALVAENARTRVEAAAKIVDMSHKHNKEVIELNSKIAGSQETPEPESEQDV